MEDCSESTLRTESNQGRVLDPLLHLLFTYDVLERTIAIFADDTGVLAVELTINQALNKVVDGQSVGVLNLVRIT